jgi:hypothetical protein
MSNEFLDGEKAPDLYNKKLKIFGQRDVEYKNLIGDEDAEEVLESTVPAGTTEYEASDFTCLNDSEIGAGEIMMQADSGVHEFRAGDYKYDVTGSPKAGETLPMIGTGKGSGGFGAYTGPRSRVYSVADPELLTEPDDDYDTAENFVFANTDTAAGVELSVGDFIWSIPGNSVGAAENWDGDAVGSVIGSIEFNVTADTWEQFATADKNGTIVFSLPRITDEDILGGTFSFYFERNAFIAAFKGNAAKMIVTIDGNLYKGSVDSANLVTHFTGHIGEAGGATAEAGGGAAGIIRMKPKNGGVWTEFGNVNDNGLKTILLPPLALSEMEVDKTFIVRTTSPCP